MEKLYQTGLIVGRFQCPHAGHEDMIRRTMALSRDTVIMVGSSQESGTRKNPFSYEFRVEMLTRLFGDAVRCFPLPDIGVGNNSRWGEYVLKQAHAYLGFYPDLLATGKEARRNSWYDGEIGETVTELYVPKTIDISATTVRRYLLDDDYEAWKVYMNPKLWDLYDRMREIALRSENNTETSSM